MATGWSGVDPSRWAENKDKLLTALLRNSVQELAKEASSTIPNGGRVPVKTGNLARSVVVDNEPPRIIEGLATGDYSLGIAGIKPGQPIYIGWQAAYARRQNYGFVGTDSLGRTYNQAGYGFAEATAAKWDGIVKAQAAKLGGR
ncbi:HK97 gp10 family phage protein [Pelagerythrobacter marinus]|nr:HK97 gp10 family phage protein [Pelagerythrobacter marinus]